MALWGHSRDRSGQRLWRVTQQPGGGTASDTSSVSGSRECEVSSGRCGKAALRGELAVRQTLGREGSPSLPLPRATADTLGQQRLKLLSHDCQMLPVCALTAFSTLNEKNLYQIKKMSNVNGSCTQVLVGQRLPLFARAAKWKGHH